MPQDSPPAADRHLWQIRPLREAAWLALAALILWVLYLLRMILAPILVAFALAYVVDPAVRLAQKRYGVPRGVSAAALLLLAVLLGLASVVWVSPVLVEQSERLVDRIPHYWESLQVRAAELRTGDPNDPNAAPAPTTQHVADRIIARTDWQQLGDSFVTGASRAFGFVGTIVSAGAYLAMAFILIIVLFVYFVATLDRVEGVKRYFPASRRDHIWELLIKIDHAFSGYVRGQFVVAIFTTTGFCIGFWLTDVPYWFIVSLIGGALSLIPYGQMSGWALAIALKYLDTQTGDATFSWLGILVAPSIVYACTQTMETWIITPWVQSESVNLHPVTIIVALLVGGAIAGVIGLILAIPATASARMLFNELVQPRLDRWAREH